MQVPFSFGEPGPLRRLFEDAGFAEVRIEPVTVETDYGEPEEYIARQITASAAAIPALKAMDDTEREAAIAAVREAMAPTIRKHTVAGRVRTRLVGSIVHADKA